MRLVLLLLVFLGIAPAEAQLLTTGAGGGVAGNVGFQGVGDIQTTVAGAFWGLRCYKASQASLSQAINIRATDGTTTDIGFTSTCDLDVTTANTFCNAHGTPCTIVTWYDLSSRGSCSGACNITEATVSKQAQLVFNCLNTSLPCALFTAASAQNYRVACATTGTGCTNATTNSFSYVAERTGNFSSIGYIFSSQTGGSNNGRSGFAASANTATINLGIGATQAASDSNFHAFVSVMGGSHLGGSSVTGDMFICVDNTCSAATTGGNFGFGTPLVLGGQDTSNYFQGQLAEFGWWVGQSFWTTTAAQNVCHNQFLYWGTSVSC